MYQSLPEVQKEQESPPASSSSSAFGSGVTMDLMVPNYDYYSIRDRGRKYQAVTSSIRHDPSRVKWLHVQENDILRIFRPASSQPCVMRILAVTRWSSRLEMLQSLGVENIYPGSGWSLERALEWLAIMVCGNEESFTHNELVVMELDPLVVETC